MIRTSAINLVLKVGLAITSFAFAILSFFKAQDVLVFYPEFIISIFGDLFTISLGAAVSFVLGVWLLSRRHKFAAAFTYTILILLAIIFNLNSIRFLSVAWPLFCMSLALSLRYYPRIRVIISKNLGNQKIEKMKIVPAFPEDDIEENSFAENKKDNDIANKYGALTVENHQIPDLAEQAVGYDESVDQFPIRREIKDLPQELRYRIEEFEAPTEEHVNELVHEQIHAEPVSEQALQAEQPQVNTHYARKHGTIIKKKKPAIKVTHRVSHDDDSDEVETDFNHNTNMDINNVDTSTGVTGDESETTHYSHGELPHKKVPRIKITKKLTHRIAHKIGLGRKSKKNDIEVQ